MNAIKKGRVFSGARPTGRQHLGNYLGAIKNYLALQEEYECVYCIVDVHALTTVETTEDLRRNTYEMALDWLALGIRPVETILFVQSQVPQVMELHTYLSMVTPAGQADRPAHIQRQSAPTAEQRQLWAGGLPGADDRGHRALQSRSGAGGHRPAAAPRVCA